MAQSPMKPRDDIVERLARHRQGATYGALAGVLGVAAIGVMHGLPKTRVNSWVVAKKTGLPSGYTTAEVDVHLAGSSRVIDDPDELRRWLETHR